MNQLTPPALVTGSLPPERSSTQDERFRFQPQATNPELWRPTQPLIVHERCAGHKGLIATWMAIHWLIVLHAASGRRDFGVREIAERARVGRNELTGPKGYIQRLVELGLLRIVDYRRIPGLREPRPVYHLDLWDLERLSLDLIPEVLRAQGVAAPPRPAPDPRQLSLFDTLDVAHGNGTAEQASAPERLSRPERPAAAIHQTGPAALAPFRATVQGTPEKVPVMPQPVPVMLTIGPATPEKVPAEPQLVPANAQKRDIEREKEREKERESDWAHTRVMFEEFAAQAAQVVLETLRQQGITPTQPATLAMQLPTTPEGQPDLPDSLIMLWQGDEPAISRRDRQQLMMLVSEIDRATDGYGAYWVGRGILIATRCLVEHGQRMNINYLRKMLQRWQREGSWGSDLERETASTPPTTNPTGAETGSRAPATGDPAPATGAQPAAAAQHAGVTAYINAFGTTPNPVQVRQIVETVTDLTLWEQVLTDWQANGWMQGAVAKMLDRYRSYIANAPGASGAEGGNILEIYQHPNIDDAERQRWLYRFTRASPAERAQLIARFRKEFPRD